VITPTNPRYLQLTPDETLTVYERYAGDGPSGPAPDVRRLMPGSLVHDVHQLLIRVPAPSVSRWDAADRALQEIARADGLPRLLSAVVYWAVRLVGRRCARHES